MNLLFISNFDYSGQFMRKYVPMVDTLPTPIVTFPTDTVTREKLNQSLIQKLRPGMVRVMEDIMDYPVHLVIMAMVCLLLMVWDQVPMLKLHILKVDSFCGC